MEGTPSRNKRAMDGAVAATRPASVMTVYTSSQSSSSALATTTVVSYQDRTVTSTVNGGTQTADSTVVATTTVTAVTTVVSYSGISGQDLTITTVVPSALNLTATSTASTTITNTATVTLTQSTYINQTLPAQTLPGQVITSTTDVYTTEYTTVYLTNTLTNTATVTSVSASESISVQSLTATATLPAVTSTLVTTVYLTSTVSTRSYLNNTVTQTSDITTTLYLTNTATVTSVSASESDLTITATSAIYTTVFVTYTDTATVTSVSASESDLTITETTDVYTTVIATNTNTATITTSTESIITQTPDPVSITTTESGVNYTTTFLQTTTLTQNVTQSVPYTVAQTDVDYLMASGVDFCSSFISSVIPTQTATLIIEPGYAATESYTQTVTSTLDYGSVYTDPTLHWKRDLSTTSSVAAPTYRRVAYVPPNSAVILGYHELPIDRPSNGSEPANIAVRMQSPRKRQAPQPYNGPIPTPASIVGWPQCLVSQACAQVATGISTSAATTSIFMPTSTVTPTTVTIVPTASCIEPAEDPNYTAFTPVWGAWSGDALAGNPQAAYRAESTIQVPFYVCLGGLCNDVVTVGTDGYVYWADNTTQAEVIASAYSGQGGGAYVYPGNDGVFYRVAGDPGYRSLVISWYTGTDWQGAEQSHWTLTLYEGISVVQYKYYDIVQDQSNLNAQSYIVIGGTATNVVNQGTAFTADVQYSITATNTDGTVSIQESPHDRVDCCLRSYWHSCTEYQAPIPGYYTCPAYDQHSVYDVAGVEYLIGCGYAIAGGQYSEGPSVTDFNDCLAACSAAGAYCIGVMLVPSNNQGDFGTNGVGEPGNCIYYTTNYDRGFSNTVDGWVGMLKLPLSAARPPPPPP